MNDDLKLAFDVLNKLNIAVLERVEPMRYRFAGEAPPFYNSLFPPSETGVCDQPWEYSPMLEIFIADAELFFERETDGILSAGVWQEDGAIDGDCALTADAMFINGKRAIVIRLLEQDFRDRFAILNDARRQLLQTREMSKNLNVYREKSRLDGLTGLINRTTFIEFLTNAIEQSDARQTNLSLIMFDIDNFKKFNDDYGHLAGDEVLRKVGAFLRSHCRSDDAAARYGGEEFCVIAQRVAKEETIKIGQKICDGIRAINNDPLPPITVSVGCATYKRGESAESLISRADLALFDVKRSTKNAVAFR
ncbi:MAG: GGDEF domain-containing protein [Helicobacteraceae bacterium]|jgi:diguanylate cyclase (GGDEF)-like protein|nr:GGDEF domain-containing protein [Helicobacteraceae bacterium]